MEIVFATEVCAACPVRQDYTRSQTTGRVLPVRPQAAHEAFQAQRYQDWNDRFLADPSLFLVMDRYPIELLFPIREGRSPQQFGKKPKDKGRWSIGVKLCWVLSWTLYIFFFGQEVL